MQEVKDMLIKYQSRCLNLAIALLRSCRPNLKDPGISNLLCGFIGPCFNRDDIRIKNLSLECLALYVLLDKKFCREYFKVYKHSLVEAVNLYQQIPDCTEI